jgi:hypothetical protein
VEKKKEKKGMFKDTKHVMAKGNLMETDRAKQWSIYVPLSVTFRHTAYY